MRKVIVAGNWKMNKTAKEAAQFFNELKPLVADVKNRSAFHCIRNSD